jgi:hypothetical protein
VGDPQHVRLVSSRYDRPLAYRRIEEELAARGVSLIRTVTNSVGFVGAHNAAMPDASTTA